MNCTQLLPLATALADKYQAQRRVFEGATLCWYHAGPKAKKRFRAAIGILSRPRAMEQAAQS